MEKLREQYENEVKQAMIKKIRLYFNNASAKIRENRYKHGFR